MSTARSIVKSLTAYDMIRDLILTGELLPGTRLVVTELEKKLGVGRGPVRDALMRLDKSGLVQNIPYKGAVVTLLPSFAEMEYIYKFRVLVETSLAVEAMRQATKSDIERLEELARSMAQSGDDEMYFFREDREFHSLLYSMANMHHLRVVVDNLFDLVETFLNARYYDASDKQLFLEQHDIIIEAIKNKDQKTLCATLETNILVGLDMIRKEMQRYKQMPKR